jgi:hypothetical protein
VHALLILLRGHLHEPAGFVMRNAVWAAARRSPYTLIPRPWVGRPANGPVVPGQVGSVHLEYRGVLEIALLMSVFREVDRHVGSLTDEQVKKVPSCNPYSQTVDCSHCRVLWSA